MGQNLSTFSKQFWSFLFMQTDASVSTDLQIHSLPAGGAVVAGDIAVSPVTAAI